MGDTGVFFQDEVNHGNDPRCLACAHVERDDEGRAWREGQTEMNLHGIVPPYPFIRTIRRADAFGRKR